MKDYSNFSGLFPLREVRIELAQDVLLAKQDFLNNYHQNIFPEFSSNDVSNWAQNTLRDKKLRGIPRYLDCYRIRIDLEDYKSIRRSKTILQVPLFLEPCSADLLDPELYNPPKGNLHPKKLPGKLREGGREEEKFRRDLKVRAAALKRAKGRCEWCQEFGFEKENGEIFLEEHHIIHLENGGPDILSNVAGICSNCHSKIHYGTNKVREDGKAHLLALRYEIDFDTEDPYYFYHEDNLYAR